MLKTFDFSLSKRYMRYWQHTALLYRVDGARVLLDATNGNVPFLFLRDGEADPMLRREGKASLPVRMVESEEQFYYHETLQGHTGEPVLCAGGLDSLLGPDAGL